MATKTRDQQKQRVYDAERAAAHAVGDIFHGRTIPNDQLQTWVDAAMTRRAIRTRWPHRRIEVVLKRGGSAYGGGGRITLPLFARNPWVILHEIAHCLTNDRHGPEFAGVFLFLVRTVIGPEAGAALLTAYRRKGRLVRHNRSGIPAPRKVPTLAAQRAKARARDTAPPSRYAIEEAVATLRRAAAAGMLGPADRKPRVHALATARALEAAAGLKAAKRSAGRSTPA